MFSGKTTQGYILDINNGKLLSTFNGDGSGFQRPHDVAVSPNGTEEYVDVLRNGGKEIMEIALSMTQLKWICLFDHSE